MISSNNNSEQQIHKPIPEQYIVIYAYKRRLAALLKRPSALDSCSKKRKFLLFDKCSANRWRVFDDGDDAIFPSGQ
jgi:hypothetical protein